MIRWNLKNIHPGNILRYGNEKDRDEAEESLKDIGVLCLSFPRDGEFWLEVCRTPTETDDRLMSEYYDEPYSPMYLESEASDEDETGD